MHNVSKTQSIYLEYEEGIYRGYYYYHLRFIFFHYDILYIIRHYPT